MDEFGIDFGEASMLLHVVKEAHGYPDLMQLRNAALQRLREMNAEVSRPRELGPSPEVNEPRSAITSTLASNEPLRGPSPLDEPANVRRD